VDLFVECLAVLAAWSKENPGHHAIVVHVEPKDAEEEQFFDFEAGPIAGHYGELDEEIRSVMAPRLLTPDDVQGTFPTLRDALLTVGWPELNETRGRFLFVMLDGGAHRENYSGYDGLSPSLAGRAMFVEARSSEIDHPLAAITRIDDPRGDNAELIGEWVGEGFLVRTRADADGREARNCRDLPDPPLPAHTEPCPVPMEPDTSRLEAALASGAHFISTDFPDGDRLGNGYFVEIPGGSPSRCNPLTAPPDCTSASIE
ncbi:MAG: Ca2+-dependent phosphoinositide-specific phospholipase C, partial [Candidatus Binatia bacterium]